jgi:hypothetical protein
MGGGTENDINYYAGPVSIRIDTNKARITIKTTHEWADMMDNILPVTREAWGYGDDDITRVGSTECHIRYNITILENYIRHNIIVM